MAESKYVAVAREDDVPEGQVRLYEVGDRSLVICRVKGQCYAVENFCTHDGGPLGEGVLDGYAIECPRHQALFDVRTGEVLRLPASAPIQSFPVRVENGDILVELEED